MSFTTSLHARLPHRSTFGAGSIAIAFALAASACGSSEGDGSRTGALRDGSTPPSGADAGQAEAGTGPTSDAGLTGADGGGAQSTDAAACARAELQTTRVIPTVWLLVDGSGSMSASLAGVAGPSRWSVLRTALLESGSGLVARLGNAVQFGLMIYDGGLSPPGIPSPLCPRVITVDPALDNFAAINAAYPAAQTGASTPTHYALLSLQDRIRMAGPSPLGPTYVVLATDGKPNLCDFHDGIPASAATEQEAVTTVAELASEGTKVFAISMANGDPELTAHLEAVASAGGTGQSAFTPTSQDALVAALTSIVGGAASCDVRVDGTIVAGRECAGDVRLNGDVLGCNDPNGFRLREDRQTLELLGTACSALQTTPSSALTATFPCEDVILR